MTAALKLIGRKFGKLTVISRNPVNSKFRVSRWNCICDCGNKITVECKHLTRGISNSCGCVQKEQTHSVNKKHGMCKTPEYMVWCNMKTLCYNERNDNYKSYGAKGIRMCDSWLRSFENFLEDMGPRPSLDHRLRRLDKSLGYELDNCKWAHKTEKGLDKSAIPKTATKLETVIESKSATQITLLTPKIVKSEWVKLFGNK